MLQNVPRFLYTSLMDSTTNQHAQHSRIHNSRLPEAAQKTQFWRVTLWSSAKNVFHIVLRIVWFVIDNCFIQTDTCRVNTLALCFLIVVIKKITSIENCVRVPVRMLSNHQTQWIFGGQKVD